MPQLTRKEAFDKFKDAQNYFTFAAKNLLQAWNDLGDADPSKSVDLSSGYPFHESFDDLVAGMQRWKEITEATGGVLDWRPEE